MPSVSKKQHNLMAAVANNPKFAKKVGIPQSVGEDFMEADKGKKFRAGGFTNPSKGKFNKPRSNHGMMQLPNVSLEKYVGKKQGGSLKGNEMKESKMMVKKEVEFMKKKGAPKSMVKHEMKEAGMKHGGMTKKMAKGGMAECKTVAKKEVKSHEKRMHKMAGGGMAYSKGGQLSKADGVAKKGKSKGAMIKMAYGGKC
jgi:hypothetical protein